MELFTDKNGWLWESTGFDPFAGREHICVTIPTAYGPPAQFQKEFDLGAIDRIDARHPQREKRRCEILREWQRDLRAKMGIQWSWTIKLV